MSTATVDDAASKTATLDDVAREGQTVTHNGKSFTTIREGLAHILVPANARTELDPRRAEGDDDTVAQSVFYNPIQQFNRDLSVLAIRAFGEDLMALRKARSEAKVQKGRKRDKKNAKAKPKEGEDLGQAAEQAADRGTKRKLETGDGTESAGKRLKVEEAEHSAVSVSGLGAGDEHLTGDDDTEVAGVDGLRLPQQPSSEQLQTEGSRQHDITGSAQTNKQRPSKYRFRILDALSATGLRALRYAHEIPFTTQVTANDLSKQATASIQANVKHNKLEDKISAIAGNALSHMYSFVGHPADKDREGKYDVIDLDPYGTAATFLDGAVQAVNDGGLLCVTCTDAGVWASCGYPEKAFSLYGGTPIKGLHSHEGGLRLILHSIATAAARYGRSIEPLLSLSIDYYARVFVRVYQSPLEVKLLAGKTMLVWNCDNGCGAWKTQLLARNQKMTAKNGNVLYKHGLAQGPTASPTCEHCGFKMHMSGPMYGGPLHNPAFLETILSYLPDLDKSTYATLDRIEGMISTALEETLVDGDPNAQTVPDKDLKGDRLVPKLDPAEVDAHPFYFVPSALAKVLHCRAPPEAELKGALRHAGYKATRSHTKPGTVRTDAPWSFIWEVMLEWERQKAPIKEDAIKPGTAGWGIMHKSRALKEDSDSKSAPHTTAEAQEASCPSVEEVAGDVTQVNITNGTTSAAEHDDVKQGTTSEKSEESDANASTNVKRQIVFDEKLGKQDPLTGTANRANKKRLVRYQTNPRANWGPMNRAKGGASSAAQPS